MSPAPGHKQTGSSVKENVAFFREQLASYSQNIDGLDTYARIREALNREIAGAGHVVDIGNGGVCGYDTGLVREITAIDLFLDSMPSAYSKPRNLTLIKGSALEIPAPGQIFDCAVMAMLIHHLVGRSVQESVENLRRALREAHRVLKPGGKLIVSESCVNSVFYSFERLIFPLASKWVAPVTKHPVTIQYPPAMLRSEIERVFGEPVRVEEIPRGKWLLQFGKKFPSVLTPARPYQFVAERR